MPLALAACAPSGATSRAITLPTTGGVAYVIECDESPDFCAKEAKNACPGGHRTIEPGRSSYYAEDEEPFGMQAVKKERKLYKQVGWTIACH